jgi:hypothetical protein
MQFAPKSYPMRTYYVRKAINNVYHYHNYNRNYTYTYNYIYCMPHKVLAFMSLERWSCMRRFPVRRCGNSL